jgi:hypothetical protein
MNLIEPIMECEFVVNIINNYHDSFEMDLIINI